MAVRHRQLGYTRFLAGALLLPLLTLILVHGYLHSCELNSLPSSLHGGGHTGILSTIKVKTSRSNLPDCLACRYNQATHAVLKEPFRGLEAPRVGTWNLGFGDLALPRSISLNIQSRAPPQFFVS